MQTPIITAKIDVTPAVNQANLTSGNSNGGASFNQFLSNEISNQQSSNASPAPSSDNSSNGNNNAVSKSGDSSNNGNNSNNNVNNQTGSKSPQPTSSSDGSGKSGGTKKSTDGKDASTSNDQSGANQAVDPNAGAQMLALVQDSTKLAAPSATDPKLADNSKIDPATIAVTANSGKTIATTATDNALATAATDSKLASDAKTGITGAKTELLAPKDTGNKNTLASDKATDFSSILKDSTQSTVKQADLTAAPVSTTSVASSQDLKLQALQDLAGAKVLQEDKAVDLSVQAPPPQALAQQLSAVPVQAATVGSDYIGQRVGSNGWDQAVSQKVMWMVAGGKQTAELSLNPPELGPMKIVLSVNNDQANATFIASHSDVRDALESAMPKLRQMMSDAGVQLSGFSVSTQLPNQSNSGQFAGNNSNSSSNTGHPDSYSTGANEISQVSGTTTQTKVISRLGMVDTFV